MDSTKEETMSEQRLQEPMLDRITGRRLTRIREQAALEIEELSILSGIGSDELAEHEAGEIPIPVTRLTPLALALGTDPLTLLARLLFPHY